MVRAIPGGGGVNRKKVIRLGHQSQVKSNQARQSHEEGRQALKGQFGGLRDDVVRAKKTRLDSENVPYFTGHTYRRGTSSLTQTGMGTPRSLGNLLVFQRGGASGAVGGFQVFNRANNRPPISGGDQISQSGGMNYMVPKRQDRYGYRPMVFPDNSIFDDSKRTTSVNQRGGIIGTLLVSGIGTLGGMAYKAIKKAIKKKRRLRQQRRALRQNTALNQKGGFFGGVLFKEFGKMGVKAATKGAIRGIGRRIARAGVKRAAKRVASMVARRGAQAAKKLASKVSKKAMSSMARRAAKAAVNSGKKMARGAMKSAAKETTRAAMDIMSGRTKISRKSLGGVVKRITKKAGGDALTAGQVKQNIAKTVSSVRRQVRRKVTKARVVARKAITKAVPQVSLSNLQQLANNDNIF